MFSVPGPFSPGPFPGTSRYYYSVVVGSEGSLKVPPYAPPLEVTKYLPR